MSTTRKMMRRIARREMEKDGLKEVNRTLRGGPILGASMAALGRSPFAILWREYYRQAMAKRFPRREAQPEDDGAEE